MTTLLTDLNVSGNLNVNGSPTLPTRASDQTFTGTLTAAAQTVVGTANAAQYTIAITGTFVASFIAEYWDGSGWNTAVDETGYWFGGTAISTAAQASFVLPMRTQIRLRCTAYTSGTVNVSVIAHEQPSAMLITTTNTGALYTRSTNNSVVSTVNSTSTNLAASGVFTGTSEDISEYADVRVAIFSSHASATNGLSIQQSSDGTNWDSSDNFTIAAATGMTYSVGAGARYFRVVYTNGATLTTSLRLQTIFHKSRTKPSSTRPQDARTNEIDTEEVSSFNMLYNGATWDRAQGVSGATNVRQPDNIATGSLTAAAQATTMSLNGQGGLAVQITGTFVATLQFEGSMDGTNFFAVPGTVLAQTGTVSSATAIGQWFFACSGLNQFRVRASAYTSGTVVVTVRASQSAPGQNTLRTGGVGRTTNPTVVADGQPTANMADKMGRQVVINGNVRELCGTQATTITSSVASTTIVAAGGAGVFRDLTNITITNGSATATNVTISDGTTPVIYNIPASGGGVQISLTVPRKATTANTVWTATCGTSVASIYIVIDYISVL